MLMTGKVISVNMDVQYPKQGGGTYQAYVLSMITDRNEKKDVVKPMASLKYRKPIENVLRDLKPGDDVSVQIEKNQAGFNDVVAMVKGPPSVDMAAQTQGPTTEPAGSATRSYTAGSARSTNTYETPEERKTKQRLIVRQAAINQAVSLHELNKSKPSFTEITDTAQAFEDWVYRGLE